ncbi:MAG: hypothetical protein WD509_02560 [Candidatus Paceibacterota bacterium]
MKIIANTFLLFGTLFAVSPLGLYWWIHGDYERYLWIINQPYPLSNFGSGPFQLFLFASLFAVGVGFLTLGFLTRKGFRDWGSVCTRVGIASSATLLTFIFTVGAVIAWDSITQQQLVGRNEKQGEALSQEQREALVSGYIEENISDLSLEEEVLGGTFYVTNIKFSGTNSGTIEYEDGHIALVADFEYSFNEERDIEVDLFNVRSKEEKVIPDFRRSENASAIVPEEWYIHEMEINSTLLSRAETLPNVGNTEGYAYGEQITINTIPFAGDSKQPENWNGISWTDDEAMVHEKWWTQIGDFIALRVRHEAGGASGGQLTWYLFSDDRVHSLFLYPADDSPHRETFTRFVYRYADLLSSSNTQNTYTNETHGFSFRYPSRWHPGLGNSDNHFQFRNYNSSLVTGGHGWGEDQNKIEGVIAPDGTYRESSDFPEESREKTTVSVGGRDATRYDVVLQGGSRVRSYVIPLENEAGEFAIISIYGDSENFRALDTAMESLEFED